MMIICTSTSIMTMTSYSTNLMKMLQVIIMIGMVCGCGKTDSSKKNTDIMIHMEQLHIRLKNE